MLSGVSFQLIGCGNTYCGSEYESILLHTVLHNSKIARQKSARDEQKGQEAVRQLSSEGLSPTFHQLDIVSPESIEKIKKYLMEQYGGLDLLVNNAGIAFKRASTVPFPEQAIVTIQTNFHGTLNVCRALLPILKPHARDVKGGTHSQKGWSSTAYGISHLGIIALTKILARNITQDSREDILINACDPGWVRTDMAGPKATKSPEEGAVTPVYAALLPINVGKPQGEFLKKKNDPRMGRDVNKITCFRS